MQPNFIWPNIFSTPFPFPSYHTPSYNRAYRYFFLSHITVPWTEYTLPLSTLPSILYPTLPLFYLFVCLHYTCVPHSVQCDLSPSSLNNECYLHLTDEANRWRKNLDDRFPSSKNDLGYVSALLDFSVWKIPGSKTPQRKQEPRHFDEGTRECTEEKYYVTSLSRANISRHAFFTPVILPFILFAWRQNWDPSWHSFSQTTYVAII